MKKLLCRLFGHKPKEYPSLEIWVEGVGRVPLHPHGPIFCERCGAGEIEMYLE